MTPRNAVLVLFAIAALVIFICVSRELSLVSYGLAANRESQEVLWQTLDDQKTLSRLDPAHRGVYRQRFENTRRLLTHLEIVALTRADVTRQVQLVLIGLVGVIVVAGIALYVIDQRSRAQRMAQLRLRYAEHLSSWQEAARRHAHEIRTPLTAAQMEVGRLVRLAKLRWPDDDHALSEAEGSVLEELDHLRRFTNNFVEFAGTGKPKLEVHDLVRLVEEFCTTFAPNWPRLTLRFAGATRLCAAIDRDMFRRVLVNLCNNSALALGENDGTVTFALKSMQGTVALDITDDGPGVDPRIRRRVFEPYTTTRNVGEGMGLGLAISKKIMIDHGGDLELLDAARGAAFRLTLPAVSCP